MVRVKVSSKYQIVIPREVREAIGIYKGQMVSVIPMGNVIEIVPDRDISEMEGIFSDLTLDGIREEPESSTP